MSFVSSRTLTRLERSAARTPRCRLAGRYPLGDESPTGSLSPSENRRKRRRVAGPDAVHDLAGAPVLVVANELEGERGLRLDCPRGRELHVSLARCRRSAVPLRPAEGRLVAADIERVAETDIDLCDERDPKAPRFGHNRRALAGDVAAGFMIFGAAQDLRAGAGAVSLGAGAGVFFVLVVFFIVRSLDCPGHKQPHGLFESVAFATPIRNGNRNLGVRHPFAIPT